MKKIFADFDFTDFWDDDEYARENYIEPTPGDELIAEIEQELGGYKLPASYIELMKMHNGGTPNKTCYPTTERTSWSDNHIAITGIMGIGRDKTYSLCGNIGSNFMLEEWGYPEIGICICSCPSAGHDMIMLDYSKCGKEGEPEVVHVDQEFDYTVTFLAKDFETFIRGLVHEDVYDTSEEDLKESLKNIENGKFSSLLNTLVSERKDLNFEAVVRNICTKVANEKGYFALHADELSYLVYDLQFLLYSKSIKVTNPESYLKAYPAMIAMSGTEFSTGGYAPAFIEEWMDDRLKKRYIKKRSWLGGLKFNPKYEADLLKKLKKFE